MCPMANGHLGLEMSREFGLFLFLQRFDLYVYQNKKNFY